MKKFWLLTTLLIGWLLLSGCNSHVNVNETSSIDENNETVESQADMPVAKMRVLEWQTEEETQAMVEEACSNMWWNWVDGECVLEDGSIVNF